MVAIVPCVTCPIGSDFSLTNVFFFYFRFNTIELSSVTEDCYSVIICARCGAKIALIETDCLAQCHREELERRISEVARGLP